MVGQRLRFINFFGTSINGHWVRVSVVVFAKKDIFRHSSGYVTIYKESLTIIDDDFLVTPLSRIMQRSPSSLNLRIHIRTSSQVLFDGFDVFRIGSIVN